VLSLHERLDHEGKCPACKLQKSNLVKHELREFDDVKRIICKDCQKIIEWYTSEIDDVNAKNLTE